MSQWMKHLVPLCGISGLIACCVLGAQTVNHILHARYLSDSAEPQWTENDRQPAPRPALEPARTGDKDGAKVAARNMFCADCTEAVPAPVDQPQDPGGIPLSELPLDLLATNMARPVRASFATVRNRDSGHQGSFFTGDRIPGAGAIERIDGSSVIFHNPHTSRRERISLLAARPAKNQRNRTKGAGRTGPGRRAQAKTNPYADRIIKIDETTYEVERSLVDNLITSPHKLGARVRPTKGENGAVAFKVYGVRGTSPLAAIGIRSGDSIEAINGYPMTTNPDKLLEMYTKLQDQQNLSISLRRRGQPLAMNYKVR